jgi:uncharacterized protein
MAVNEILLLVVIGILSGVLAGFFGVGGAIIVIPALIFFFGLSQHQAQGTSLAFLLAPIGLFAFVNYYKAGYVNVKYAIIIGLAFMLGAYFGSKIAIRIDGEYLKKAFAVLVILMGIRLFF